MDGVTYKVQSGCCMLYVTINSDDVGPKEVFINTSGSGCSALINALGRSISIGLQNGVSPEEYKATLHKAVCPACVKNAKAEGRSCADVVGNLLNG